MSEFVDVVVADLADHAGREDRDGDSAARLATLLLSRPPTNALTRQVYREIAEAAAALDARDDIAAVILFGGHEIFCAGDDMPERATLSAEETEAGARLSAQAVDAVGALTKPTVAAITGYALGAGLTLALATDWRISGDNAKFGATEILAGLHYAHSLTDEEGTCLAIVHRDVSPENILLTDQGDVKVLDFGIAKVLESSGNNMEVGLTGTGVLLGTAELARKARKNFIMFSDDDGQLALKINFFTG